jgi:hypothetical protein
MHRGAKHAKGDISDRLTTAVRETGAAAKNLSGSPV